MGPRAGTCGASTTTCTAHPSTSIAGSARPSCPSDSELGPRLHTSLFMPPETALLAKFTERDWVDARAELAAAQQAVAGSPAGIARQAPFDRALASERRGTGIIHERLCPNLDVECVRGALHWAFV